MYLFNHIGCKWWLLTKCPICFGCSHWSLHVFQLIQQQEKFPWHDQIYLLWKVLTYVALIICHFLTQGCFAYLVLWNTNNRCNIFSSIPSVTRQHPDINSLPGQRFNNISSIFSNLIFQVYKTSKGVIHSNKDYWLILKILHFLKRIIINSIPVEKKQLIEICHKQWPIRPPKTKQKYYVLLSTVMATYSPVAFEVLTKIKWQWYIQHIWLHIEENFYMMTRITCNRKKEDYVATCISYLTSMLGNRGIKPNRAKTSHA